MPKCIHNRPLALSIHGGFGIEWCQDCGAFRRLSFGTAKSGLTSTATEWKEPTGAPPDPDLLQSEIPTPSSP